MSFRSKNSLIIAIVWSIILLLMIFVFGAVKYSTLGKLISAAGIFTGVWVDIFMLSRNKKEAFDERVNKISHKSTSVSMIITLMYVFVFCIVLTEVYPNEMHSDWLWLLAYTMIAVANISSSVMFIFFDKKGIPYED